MAVTMPKNDGAVQYGTRVLTIGSAANGTGGTTYVAENFSVNRPTKTIERFNEVDELNGQVTYVAPVTGSATLQLAASATPEPLLGWEFQVTLDAGVGSETYYLSDVGRAEGQGTERKINVSFRKRVTAST
jgi:hypothetical protein